MENVDIRCIPYKIFVEKNGERREVTQGSVIDQLDLVRAHRADLEPALRKYFGDRVYETIVAWECGDDGKNNGSNKV